MEGREKSVTNETSRKQGVEGADGNRSFPWPVRIRNLGLFVLCIAICSLILVVQVIPADEVEQLRVGDVAPRNILAPRRITYVSEIETEAARTRAEADVAEIHDLP